jgi:hypothetical protein
MSVNRPSQRRASDVKTAVGELAFAAAFRKQAKKAGVVGKRSRLKKRMRNLTVLPPSFSMLWC